MHEDGRQSDPDIQFRRTVLRTVGSGVLTAMAGCLFGGGESDQNSSDDARSRRPEPTTSDAENQSRMNRTVTHEQSIITSGITTTVSEMTDASSTAPRTTTSETRTEPPTQEPTTVPTATPTTTSISTPTPEPTQTATEASTQEQSTAQTEALTETSTTIPTAEPTATSTLGEIPAAGSRWVERAPLPVAGSDAGCGVLDGKLYFFGGIETATGLAAVDRTFVYDPTSGTDGRWERLPAFPEALWGPCGVATDEELYSFGGAPTNGPYEGGSPPSDAVFRYRPGGGWADLTDTQGVRCPYPNWVMGGVYNSSDGLIYCVGGGTGAHDAETATDHGFDGEVPGTFDESRIWTFDPTREEVADPDLARMPEAKRWPTVALLDTNDKRYIHTIGGLLGTTGPTDTNFRYDIEAGEWETAQPMPQAGTYATHSNPVIDNQAYLTHGMFWEGRPTIDRYETVAHRYDPASDSFETDLSEPTYRRGGAVSGVIDGTLYVVGGHIKRFDRNGLHDCVAYNETYTPVR